LAGFGIVVLPYVSIPTNVIMHDTLDPSNDHISTKEIWLEPGDYEIWMTENFWSNFNIDYPIVNVNHSGGEPVHVYMHMEGAGRTIEDNRCRHFASFTIEDKGYYTVNVAAGLMVIGFPGSHEVYVTEERPALFGTLLWTGGLLMLVGISVVVLELLRRVWESKDKGLDAPTEPPHAPVPPYSAQYYPPAPAPPPRLEQVPPPYPNRPNPPTPPAPPPQAPSAPVEFEPVAPPRRPSPPS
jgi:hypothetical protein